MVGFEESDRTELALRVCRDGRAGLIGGSLPNNEVSILTYVERAEAAASNGPYETIFAPPVRLPLTLDMPSLPSPDALVSRMSELHTQLSQRRPGFQWSGKLSLVQRVARVIHSDGLDAWNGSTEYRLRLRARRAAGQAPVDRILHVSAREWLEAVDEVNHRVEAEFPESENLAGAPVGVPHALGPNVVAQLCLALLKPRFSSELPRLDQRVSLVDEPSPGHQGCDDEGVLVHPLPVVDSGCFCDPWASVIRRGRALQGRAFRATIDSPPATSPMSLRWTGRGVDCVKKSILLSEIAGLSLQSDGALHGCAIEGIVLDEGRPTHRCRGTELRLRPDLVFTKMIGEITARRFAVGKHRMPQLVLA